MTNPYVQYYLDQQGRGMSVFKGSPWQMGHGQMGYGLGGLFRSVARAVMPMVKSGAKALGKIALNAGANVLGDVASGKSLKESVRTRGKEAVHVAKNKAVNRLTQTGSGRKRTPKKGQKRKASASSTRSRQTKKRKTTPEDIFG